METYAVPGLDRRTVIAVFSSLGLLLAWSFGSSLLEAGPISASIITYCLYIFYWYYAIRFKNPLIYRLVIFGTVAGILELVTDHYLVDTINSLIYPGNELMIWSSPAYMPFAWSNVLLQLGFIGVWLTKKYNIFKASVILSIAGGMYIPIYEHLAKDAGWWIYNNNTTMIFNAPVYVILCEALISLSLPLLIFYSLDRKPIRAITLGIVEGVWILLSAALAFGLAR
ncbi:DUF6989 domain-containing protein [Fulvivirga imtechensis]|uniref:DUF6989 domain-containing protein n=1 Tax=Fulvivirga imtechensis TaxID=881893 RepID=UPI0012F86DAC|nr:hypothetical protein [Fulvivirga imtechensis]